MKTFQAAAIVAVMLVSGAFHKAYANEVSFGASTSGSLTLTADPNVCYYADCSPGFSLSGGLFGTDSNGSSYDLYVPGGLAYFASNPAGLINPPANQWYWFLGTFLDLYDPALPAYGADGYNSGGLQAQQASDGLLTILYSSVNTNNGLTNYVLDLQVDPVMISSMQPGQQVTLTALGGCESTGTSCSPTSPPPVPEPASVVLLSTGLLSMLVLAVFRQRRFRFAEAKDFEPR